LIDLPNEFKGIPVRGRNTDFHCIALGESCGSEYRGEPRKNHQTKQTDFEAHNAISCGPTDKAFTADYRRKLSMRQEARSDVRKEREANSYDVLSYTMSKPNGLPVRQRRQ
jgi:hypothetical protein